MKKIKIIVYEKDCTTPFKYIDPNDWEASVDELENQVRNCEIAGFEVDLSSPPTECEVLIVTKRIVTYIVSPLFGHKVKTDEKLERRLDMMDISVLISLLCCNFEIELCMNEIDPLSMGFTIKDIVDVVMVKIKDKQDGN